MFMFGIVVVLLIATSPALVHLGLGGVVVAQLAIIGGIPVGTAIMHRVNLLDALGLHRPTLRALAGAAAIGVSFWCVNLWLIVPMTDADANELRALEEIIFGNSLPLWLIVVMLAVVPALCEEILVRGVIARSLRPKLGVAGAILVSGALFGLMHMSVARFLPTAAFGIVLAYITLASGSVVPAMLAHGLNNAMALLLAGGQIPQLMASLEERPTAWGLGATGVCAIGAVLMWRSAAPPAPD
jgi:membrane protease YdiL (CAAX protease family)